VRFERSKRSISSLLVCLDTPYITSSKLSLDQEICIGPHCGAVYWNCNVGQPTIITAITNWQSTSIEPAFWDADGVPDFARPISDPSYEDQIEPKSEACAKAFNVCTQFLLPKLSEPRLMDESFFRPFRYCCRTWEDGVVVFREELIQTAGRWEELGLVESCPFPSPGPDEYAVHRKDYKLFEAAHELKYSLSDLLNTASDGWTPPEDWEAAKSANQGTFTGMLQDVLDNEHSDDDDEPIRDEADLREIWP
jgi:hypothetical protein